MNTWRIIDGLAQWARQLLIFILASFICVGVAVSPAQAADPAPPNVTPKLLGSFNQRGASEVAVEGNRAYVAEYGSELQIIDVSDPAAPKLLGSFDTLGDVLRVAVEGNRAYVEDRYKGLQIIDVSDPAAPRLLGSFDTPGNARGVALAGNRAYVADSESGLQIIDVSDPAAPKLLGSFDTPGNARGVALAGKAGNRAYVADSESGLQIIDVSDPAAPKLLGSFDTPGNARGVALAGKAGNRAYVTEGYGYSGLQIIDVSDPAAPKLLGSFDTPGDALGVAVEGNRAYVADDDERLQIIDVSDPAAPKPLYSLDIGGNGYSVVLVGNKAYVANGDQGLQIIDVTPYIPTIPVSLSVAPRTVTETGSPTVTITVTTGSPVVGSQTIDVALNGTATADDFTTAIPATITIPEGATEGFLTLNIKEDNLSEGTETATFTISNPSSGLTLDATTIAEIALAEEPPRCISTSCSDFDSQAKAQAVLDALPDDRFGLDPDGNGIACDREFDIKVVGEVGNISGLTHEIETVSLNHTFTHPVVFAQPASFSGWDPIAVRLSNVTGNSFQVRLQEPSNLNNRHVRESLSYLVLEAGRWQLSDGTLLEAGTRDTSEIVSKDFDTVNFSGDFDAIPVVFSQVQTSNGSDFVRTRQREASIGGFQVGLEKEEKLANSDSAKETLGWFAIEATNGTWSGHAYQAKTVGDLNDEFTSIPLSWFEGAPELIGALASYAGPNPAGLRYRNLKPNGVEMKVEEDTSLDNETLHVVEDASVFAIAGSGLLNGTPVSSAIN